MVARGCWARGAWLESVSGALEALAVECDAAGGFEAQRERRGEEKVEGQNIHKINERQ